MNVILMQDVEGLGQAGDLKDVANGYARNYLLPRKLVVGATATLVATREQRIAAERRRLAKQVELNQQQAARLGQVTLVFKARVGTRGRLYGSITNQDIATALHEAEGINVDRRMIDLPNTIRALGTFTVPVKIASRLHPTITVQVIDENIDAVKEQQKADN